MPAQTILRVDSSARLVNSVSRNLTDAIVDRFASADVITRDLAHTPLPQIDEGFITLTRGATAANVNPEQKDMLALSNALIGELRTADIVVIGLPVYNFSLPAALKAWIDLIARAGETFRYTEDGPIGLLNDKRVIIAMASGGTEADSDIDYATPYLRHILGFMGMTDIELIRADRLAFDAEATVSAAFAQVKELAA